MKLLRKDGPSINNRIPASGKEKIHGIIPGHGCDGPDMIHKLKNGTVIIQLCPKIVNGNGSIVPGDGEPELRNMGAPGESGDGTPEPPPAGSTSGGSSGSIGTAEGMRGVATPEVPHPHGSIDTAGGEEDTAGMELHVRHRKIVLRSPNGSSAVGPVLSAEYVPVQQAVAVGGDEVRVVWRQRVRHDGAAVDPLLELLRISFSIFFLPVVTSSGGRKRGGSMNPALRRKGR